MSEAKRKTDTAAFKAKVALEAIRGVKTVHEIGPAYGVHPVQVGQWKREVLEQAETLFATKRGPKIVAGPADTERLYSEIGRLKMELDWLKKVRAEPVSVRRTWIERHGEMAVSRQCGLAGVARSWVYGARGADVRLAHGFADLVAVIDWYARRVLAWRLSNSLEAGFCVDCLEEALRAHGPPEIFNSDQGTPFTSAAFTGVLLERGIAISMDGRGRALDKIFVERLWRTLKYEDIDLRGYASLPELLLGLTEYFAFYNDERPHQALGDRTPGAVDRSGEGGGAKIGDRGGSPAGDQGQRQGTVCDSTGTA